MTTCRNGVWFAACLILVGCANKQILRNEAVMTKQLGSAVSGLEQLSGSSLHDRRMLEMTEPPTDPDARGAKRKPGLDDFLDIACKADADEHSVGQALRVYSSRLEELDKLAQAPGDNSFAAMFKSMKRSSDAREQIPDTPQAAQDLFDKAQARAAKRSKIQSMRCRTILQADLAADNAALRMNAVDESGKVLAVIDFARALTSVVEQTKRANAVRAYTEQVVGPDLNRAYLYLASTPNTQVPPEGKLPDALVQPQVCSVREDFVRKVWDGDDEPTQTGIDALQANQAYGRLAILAARTRIAAATEAYLHYRAAQELKPRWDANARRPEQVSAVRLELAHRSADEAAQALARFDGLVHVDVDCEILPKLHSAQAKFVDTVVNGGETGEAVDRVSDALTSLQTLLDAFDKAKKKL